MVYIPQNGQLVAGKVVHQLAQLGRVGIQRAGFDQQGYTLLHGVGQQGGNGLTDHLGAILGGKGTYAGHAQIARQGN